MFFFSNIVTRRIIHSFFIRDTKRSDQCELTSVIASDNFLSTTISCPILDRTSRSCQSMSLVGSNVSSVIFSFLFTTERRHPKKITIGDFFKPGFSRKVRIQLFLKFFTANRKHSRCLKDYRDKKKRILFYTGGRKNLGFFQSCHEKYSTGSWTVMVFGISVIKY